MILLGLAKYRFSILCESGLPDKPYRLRIGPLLAGRVARAIEPMAELVAETLIARLPEV